MANLTVTVPDVMVQRIQNAFTADPEFASSGLTALQFVQKKMRDYVKNEVIIHEVRIVTDIAEQQAITDIG